ncbi:MAG TPA: hypothetical protein VL400_01160 [Polyangiaceae bacterium]|nr:hypothetical protein [Polyangiaceae bacterium]
MSDDPDKPDAPDGDDDERIRAMVKGAMRRAPEKSDPSKRAAAADDADDAPKTGERRASDADEGDLPRGDEPPDVLVDEVDLKEALRGALQPPPGSVAPNLLSGVQRRLRVRSRGKFYGDGWSTAESPKSTYLVTSVLMLVLIALVFLVLVPWSSTKLP